MPTKLFVTLLVTMFPLVAKGDVIHFKDGRKVQVTQAWEEGSQVKCERFGGIIGYPKSTVDRIERGATVTEEEKKTIEPSGRPETAGDNKLAKDLAEKAFHEISDNGLSRSARQSAMEKLERARKLNPQEAWIYVTESKLALLHGYKIGTWYEAESFMPGTVDRAIEIANRAVQYDPQFSRGYSQLAHLYIVNGNYDKAAELLETAYGLDNESFGVWLYKGTLALQMKDMETASKMFDEALKYATHEYERSTIRGRKRDIARIVGNAAEEERLLLEGIAEDPNDAYAYGAYAGFLMRHGRHHEAIGYWEKAIEIKPYRHAIRRLEDAKKMVK